MKFLKSTILLLSVLISVNCQSKNKTTKKVVSEVKLSSKDLQEYKTAYFASGCFWCAEAIFESVKGVKEVVSGYSGGTEKNPTYEEVGSGRTGHAESVKIYYDPKEVSFKTLVKVFFGSHDPTTLNRQGPDRGTQYRSIAFYQNGQEKQIIEDYIATLEKNKTFSAPIVTQVVPFTKFYNAEDYHQDYERNHPNNPYIRNVSIPRIEKFKRKFPELLKENSH